MQRLPHRHRDRQNFLATLEQRQRHHGQNLMAVGYADPGIAVIS